MRPADRSGRVLATRRLRLDPVPPGLAEDLLAGALPADLPAGAGWPDEGTLALLGQDLAADDPGRTGWLVRLAGTGTVIGGVGWRGGPDGSGRVELGYALAGPYRGRGYGGEAVAAVVAYCRRLPEVAVITASVRPGNEPSRRLLGRLGFRPAGPDGDHLLFELR